MDLTARFRDLVERPAADVPLDEAALLLAACTHDVDIPRALSALDDLAARCRDASFDGLRVHLFEHEGFDGNRTAYDDPDNSYLDRVIDRRRGIPISLSAVMIVVGARVGVPVVGIGMPAHFLVRDAMSDVYCDPFNGGQLHDAAGCAELFATLTHGAPFDPSYLAPVDTHQILTRMCNNLERGPLAHDPDAIGRLAALHVHIPGLDASERDAVLARARALRARFN